MSECEMSVQEMALSDPSTSVVQSVLLTVHTLMYKTTFHSARQWICWLIRSLSEFYAGTCSFYPMQSIPISMHLIDFRLNVFCWFPAPKVQ